MMVFLAYQKIPANFSVGKEYSYENVVFFKFSILLGKLYC